VRNNPNRGIPDGLSTSRRLKAPAFGGPFYLRAMHLDLQVATQPVKWVNPVINPLLANFEVYARKISLRELQFISCELQDALVGQYFPT
jgi:hypothetical protein